jgi:phosphonate transport system substrate-binding protein
MQPIVSWSVLSFSALMCVSLSGCKVSSPSDAWPRKLNDAYSPQAEQLQGAMRAQQSGEPRQYLESQLHIPVNLVQVSQYAATIEATRADKVDIAHFGGLSYLIAAQKAGAQAIVARGYADGTLDGSYSLIAVPKDRPDHSMAELKARAKDIVFAFADPAPTSGDLYPRVGLQDLGINPERDFKQALYANGHLADLMAIISGKVDAGAFDPMYMTRLIDQGKMRPGDIRILWRSELIPDEPVAVRGGLPERLKKEIQAAYLAIPANDPALWASLKKSLYCSTAGITDLPATDATYNGLRRYALQVKQFNFLEK